MGNNGNFYNQIRNFSKLNKFNLIKTGTLIKGNNCIWSVPLATLQITFNSELYLVSIFNQAIYTLLQCHTILRNC